MDEQKRQVRFLVVIAAVLCAVIIGYNAFYVPDAPLSEPTIAADLPPSNSAAEAYSPSSVQLGSLPAKSPVSAHAAAGKVNINTATVQELNDKLSGIGDGLAQRIVSYRQKHGPFRSVEAIKSVSGIGDKKFEAIQNYITVG